MQVVTNAQRFLPRHVRPLSSSRRVHEQVLPDAKLRLMISLHHQARSFITPENLDVAIIRAFAPENTVVDETTRLSLSTIYGRMNSSRTQSSEVSDNEYRGSAFEHGGASTRIDTVAGALFGTHTVGRQSGLPGLEVVREQVATLAAQDTSSTGQQQKS